MDNREIFINTLKSLDLPTKELLNKYLKAYGESIRISAKDEGLRLGEKQIVDLIIEQKRVYEKNNEGSNSKWLNGCIDCCNYLLQLIKEKRLKELGVKEK